MASETFNYTGGEQTWTVPDGVDTIDIDVKGAEGGYGSPQQARAAGARVEDTGISVTPGETLYIYVGGSGSDGQFVNGTGTASGGSGGWNGGGQGGDTYVSNSSAEAIFGGGGGGGASDIRQGGNTESDRIVVAGGGGGAGGVYDTGARYLGGEGGVGGDTGQNGVDSDAPGGDGGTDTSGGAGGNATYDGTSGGQNTGGSGADVPTSATEATGGGGGGSGIYGGGGGAAPSSGTGGGGGGGSSMGVTSSATIYDGDNSGDGQITITYPEPPGSPNNTTETIQDDTTIGVTWDENTSRGDTSDYDVQVSVDGSSYTQVANVDDSTTSYTYTADAADNEHQFRVRANNSHGSSDWSTTSVKATDATGLSLDATRETETDLSWTPADDESGYHIYQAEASGSIQADYTQVADVAAGTTSTTVTGLENGETYYWRVAAYYSSGDSQLTGEVSGTTTLPAPTLDSVTSTTEGEADLSWTKTDNSTDGSWEIDRSADGGSTWSTVATGIALATTTHTDTGLLDGEKYTYRVRRVTDHTSSKSNTLAATTPLPAPTDLTGSNITDTTADYSWTANHDNGETRVEYRPTTPDGEPDVPWQIYDTVTYDVESVTVDGLKTGEEYEGRVVAQTNHDETEDV